MRRDTTVHEHKHFDDDLPYVRESAVQAEKLAVNGFIEQILRERLVLEDEVKRLLPRAAADDKLIDDLQRELAFHFGAYHSQMGHNLDAAHCRENDCERVKKLLHAPRAETVLTVEQCLAELREMFPEASFISAKTHAIYQTDWTHQPQSDIQIEDKGFRRQTLDDAMDEVRAWAKSRAEREGE